MKFIVSVILLYSFQILTAQSSISGVLVDKNTLQPLDSLYVKLYNPIQNKLVSNAVTEIEGKFIFKNIPHGEYEIIIENEGYREFYAPLKLQDDYQFNIIYLEPEITLDNVELISKKSVTSTPTGSVIKVEGTALSNRKNAVEVLKTAPNIVMLNGISVLGSDNVSFQINGKEQQMTEKQFLHYLTHLSPKTVGNIEITDVKNSNMSGEKDAIINVILKNEKGTQVDVGLGYNNLFQNVKNNHDINFSFFKMKNKWRFFSDFSYSVNSEKFDETQVDKYNGTTNKTFMPVILGSVFESNANVGADYHINDTKLLSFLFTNNVEKMNNQDIDFYINSLTGVEHDSIHSKEFMDESTVYNALSVYYQVNKEHSIFKIGSSVSINTIAENRDLKSEFYQNQSYVSDEYLRQYLDNDNQFYTFDASYSKDLNENKSISYGVKNTFIHYLNLDQTYFLDSDTWQLNPDFSGSLNFNQNIAAGYFNFVYKKNKSTLTLGLRDEWTHDQYNFSGYKNSSSFNNLLPSAIYTYKTEKKNTWTLQLNSKINRPNFPYYNPQIFINNPLSQYQGNPDIKARVDYIAGLRWNVKKKYSFDFKYTYTNTAIYHKREILDNGIIRLKPQNEGIINKTSLTLSAPLDILPWWKIQNSLAVNYRHNTYDTETFFGFDGLYKLNNIWEFDNGLVFALDFTHRTPFYSGYYHVKSLSLANATLDIPLFKGATTLSLWLNDIFNSNITKYEVNFQNTYQYNETKGDFQKFGLSFSYTFAKGKENDIEEKDNLLENERKRLGKEIN